MAAFVTLTDGTYTFRITNAAGGEIYNDNFFKPGIKSLTNPKFGGDDYARLRDCTLKVKYDIKDITDTVEMNAVWNTKAKRQLTCTMVMWDGDTAITYTDLKAVRFGRGQVYTYTVISEKITDDLLTAAPDVKATAGSDTYNDKRYYPRVFGTVKHVKPFLLIKDVLQYYSAGELRECYSRGQTQTVDKNNDKTFEADTAIVEPFTMDVSNGTQTAETLTRKLVRPENFVFYQATEPSTADYLLTEGMRWVDTSDTSGKQEYRWSASAWVSVRDGRVDSGLNDSGQIKQIVKGVNLPTTGMVTGLNVTQNYLGYYDGSSWDAFIDDEGGFYFGDGGGTIGTNYFLSFYNATNGIGGGGTPDTFVISTPEFEVDASGNATFAGTLSSATYRTLTDDNKETSAFISELFKGDVFLSGSTTWSLDFGLYSYNSTDVSFIKSKSQEDYIEFSGRDATPIGTPPRQYLRIGSMTVSGETTFSGSISFGTGTNSSVSFSNTDTSLPSEKTICDVSGTYTMNGVSFYIDNPSSGTYTFYVLQYGNFSASGNGSLQFSFTTNGTSVGRVFNSFTMKKDNL